MAVKRIGITQELSETPISTEVIIGGSRRLGFCLCRASCYKSGNPPNALASQRPLRLDFPLPVRKFLSVLCG